jgi:hypothetical protein
VSRTDNRQTPPESAKRALWQAFNGAWTEIEHRLRPEQDTTAVRAVLAQAMIDLAWRGVADPRELKARGFMVVEYSFPHIIKDVRAES